MGDFLETSGGTAVAYTELQATAKSVVSSYFNGTDSGNNPLNYFDMTTLPSIASQLLISISQPTGSCDFAHKCTIGIDSVATYLFKTALAYDISPVEILPNNIYGKDARIRYTRNHAINLFKDITFFINSIGTNVLGSTYLDYYRSNRLSQEERNTFDRLTCNTADYLNGNSKKLQKADVMFPIPFYFTKETGIALPISLLKICRNEIKFNIADWPEIIIFENVVTGEKTVPVVGRDIVSAPHLSRLRLLGEYALIETGALAQTIKDRRLTVEHITNMNSENFNPTTCGNASYQVQFNYLQKSVVVALKNTTFPNEHSNYSCGSPAPMNNYTNFLTEYGTQSPINSMTVSYGTQTKITANSKYFKLLVPFWHAKYQPESQSNMLVQNYCLEMDDLNPTGGCALSIMNRVMIKIEPTAAAKIASAGGGTLKSGIKEKQQFVFSAFAISLAIMVTGPSSCVAPS